MSKYTTQVRFICENAAGYDESKGFNDVDEIIEASIPSIFSFDFPVFDESYRNVICTKILRHYYTREIGLETVGLWKLKLQTKLNELMPYYNKLYNSELLKFNPFYDVDMQTTHVGNKDENRVNVGSHNEERSSEGSTSTDSLVSTINNGKNEKNEIGAEDRKDSNTKVNGRNYSESENIKSIDADESNDLYSDTPQGGLNGVNAETYLTNARKITTGKNNVTDKAKSGKDDSSEVNQAEYAKNNNVNVNEKFEEDSLSSRNSKNEFSQTENNSVNKNETDKFNSTESYLLHVVGKQAGNSYSKLLSEFRKTFLNIDMEVIESISDLFMNLW